MGQRRPAQIAPAATLGARVWPSTAVFDLVQTTPELITGALDLHVLHSLSFYDALILQAAATGGCPRLLSEDMQDGAVIARVTVENPFRG